MILSGVFDRFPSLRFLLAHSGGTLPQLSSRLAFCIAHDPVVSSRLKHDARYYLGRLWFDALSYGPEELRFVSSVIARAKNVEPGSEHTSTPIKIGSQRLLFGSDNPFFQDLEEKEKWTSVTENLGAINAVEGWDEADKDRVRGGNALSLFNL
jgi:aminocarboxymuconate-semialdehyde decarboxylase